MEVAKVNKLENIHPGEVLLEEFLVPLGLSQNRIAREIGVPPRRINEIVQNQYVAMCLISALARS